MRLILVALFALLGCDSCSSEPAATPASRSSAERASGEPSPSPPPSLPEPTAVSLEASDGTSLAADFAPGAEPSSAVVVLFHQLGRDRTEWTPLSQSLRRAGFSVLRVDLRGHGASEGGPDGWRSFDDAAWAAVVEDGRAALAWLRERSETEPPTVILGGSSIGSSVALVAGSDPMVDGVFALSPGRAYRGIDVLTPVDGYPEERPLLAVAARGEVASAETARELARIAESGEARLVDGNAHGLAMLADQPGLVAVIENFVQEVMGGE